jgi:hypothetical protein
MYMKGKLIAAFVGGIGLGGVVGWAITADLYEQKLKEQEERVDILQALWESSQEEQVAHYDAQVEVTRDEKVEPENPPEQNSGETAVTDEQQETNEATTEATRTHLQELIDKYSANPEDRDEFVNKAAGAVNSNDPPFVIDRGTYAFDDEGQYYDKTTVTYYPSHRVLLDEDDEVVDEPGIVVGWRNLSRFGDESEDPDVVFVRNRRLRTDYEVVKDEDSPLPTHVIYGLGREEFNTEKAAGTLRLREEDL